MHRSSVMKRRGSHSSDCSTRRPASAADNSVRVAPGSCVWSGFQVGDVITVVNRDDAGWWEGELNGQKGLFPRSATHGQGAKRSAVRRHGPKTLAEGLEADRQLCVCSLPRRLWQQLCGSRG